MSESLPASQQPLRVTLEDLDGLPRAESTARDAADLVASTPKSYGNIHETPDAPVLAQEKGVFCYRHGFIWAWLDAWERF